MRLDLAHGLDRFDEDRSGRPVKAFGADEIGDEVSDLGLCLLLILQGIFELFQVLVETGGDGE